MHGGIPLAELVVLLALAAAGAALFERLRLPSIAGFLVAGALVGPGGLGLVSDPAAVRTLAEAGVVFLLFEIGLELPVERLRRLLRSGLDRGRAPGQRDARGHRRRRRRARRAGAHRARARRARRDVQHRAGGAPALGAQRARCAARPARRRHPAVPGPLHRAVPAGGAASREPGAARLCADRRRARASGAGRRRVLCGDALRAAARALGGGGPALARGVQPGRGAGRRGRRAGRAGARAGPRGGRVPRRPRGCGLAVGASALRRGAPAARRATRRVLHRGGDAARRAPRLRARGRRRLDAGGRDAAQGGGRGGRARLRAALRPARLRAHRARARADGGVLLRARRGGRHGGPARPRALAGLRGRLGAESRGVALRAARGAGVVRWALAPRAHPERRSRARPLRPRARDRLRPGGPEPRACAAGHPDSVARRGCEPELRGRSGGPRGEPGRIRRRHAAGAARAARGEGRAHRGRGDHGSAGDAPHRRAWCTA